MTEWVSRGADIVTLLAWLRGDNSLASLGSGAPPYFRILSAMPDQGDDRVAARSSLAERAAELLERGPDADPGQLGVDGPEILYNLLYLSAGLSWPKTLAGPLLRMLQRRRLNGSSNGVRLKDALRDALIENQPDSKELVQIWRSFFRTEQSDFLEGDEFAGFRGLVKATDRQGRPNLANIGCALTLMADYLDRQRKNRRRELFADRARYVDECYSLRGGLKDHEWREAVSHSGLPRWAAESLPKLTSWLDNGNVIVWSPIVSCIPFNYEPVRPLYAGAALELSPSPKARDFILSVWPVFEQSRLNFIYDSPRAQFCMLNQIYMYLERLWESQEKREYAKFIRKSRAVLLHDALDAGSTDPTQKETFDRKCEKLAEYAKERFQEATESEWVSLAEGATSVLSRPLEQVPDVGVGAWMARIYSEPQICAPR